MTDDLEHLLAVQDLDTSITQLQHRRQALLESSGLAAVEAQLAAIEAERADAAARRGVLTATQKELEEQIAVISERRSGVEQRMYASTSSSGRDLQAMNDEVRHLTDRRAELEELELVAMLEQDPIDAELAALRERAAPLEAQAEELRGQVAGDQVEIDAALGEAVGRPGGRGGAAADRALRPLRDAAGPPQGHRGGAPGGQPLRRLPSRAVLGGGREDPRPSSRRGGHLRAVRPHPRPRLRGCVSRADPGAPR